MDPQRDWPAAPAGRSAAWWTVAFVGEVLLACARRARGGPGSAPGEWRRLLDHAGPRSVPIVLLTCSLIGLMLAYMAGAQLGRIGAQAYLADVVTVGMVRELAGMMTGIVLAGRVGASFASQLAAMRAGEEIDALRAAGIEVEVVPGVSAGLAAAANLGVPLTDRRAAQGVAFVTGHTQTGGRQPDWAALARSGLTLVVYMGLRRAGAIARALRDSGAREDTPVAVVLRASLPAVSRRLTTLGALAESEGEADTGAGSRGAPGVLLVGDVLRALAALAGAAGSLPGTVRGVACGVAPGFAPGGVDPGGPGGGVAAAGIIAACDAA